MDPSGRPRPWPPARPTSTQRRSPAAAASMTPKSASADPAGAASGSSVPSCTRRMRRDASGRSCAGSRTCAAARSRQKRRGCGAPQTRPVSAFAARRSSSTSCGKSQCSRPWRRSAAAALGVARQPSSTCTTSSEISQSSCTNLRRRPRPRSPQSRRCGRGRGRAWWSEDRCQPGPSVQHESDAARRWDGRGVQLTHA